VKRDIKHITDDILVKYLLGEATAEEQQYIEKWISENVDHQRYFQHFKLIWDESKKLAITSTVNENEAWERFKQRTQQNLNTSTYTIRPAFQWARAAAILLLVAGAGWLFYYLKTGRTTRVYVQSKESVLTDTLPDGTVVTLNKRSSISYPTEFTGNIRPVTLHGEAFFNVAHNKSKPFIIHANDAVIQVVGTSFNVNSNPDKTEVIVETGIVLVSKEHNSIRITPHEKAIVLKGQPVPVKQVNLDELYNYYRTKEFVCKATPLWKLVAVLNEAYDAHIVIANNDIKNLPLTTTFRDDSLDNILVVIGETFNINIEKTDKEIILK